LRRKVWRFGIRSCAYTIRDALSCKAAVRILAAFWRYGFKPVIRCNLLERLLCGTLPTLPFPVFADAAFDCRCGILVAALQLISPDRSLKSSLRGGIQSALSPQPGPAIEERDVAAFC